MKKISVLLLIIGYFAVHSSAQFSAGLIERGRFNITLNELKEQCNYNGGGLMFDNILRNLQTFRNYRNTLLGQLNTATTGSPPEGNYETVFVINQICGTNPEVINFVRQLIENVQFCLNADRRLSERGLQKVMENMVNGVCLQFEFERALSTQPQCLSELMTSLHSPSDECSLLFPKFKTVYSLEPIPIFYSDDECSDFIKAADCRLNSRRNCDVNLKSIIKERFYMALGLIYCENAPVSKFSQNNLLRYAQ